MEGRGRSLIYEVMKRCINLAMYIELLCMYIVEGKLTRVKLFGSESIDGKVWSLGADSAV